MPTASGHTRAIRAKTVIGTAIKDSNGKSIGKIEDIVLDKMSNEILFAVAGFGGIVGLGEKFHPVPWSLLDYRPDENAYYCAVTEAQLKAAPADSIDELTRDDGRTYRDSSYTHYGVPAS